MNFLDEYSPKSKKRLKLKKILSFPPIFVFLLIFSLTPAPLSINEAVASSFKPGILIQEFEIEQAVFMAVERKREEIIYKNREYLTLSYFQEKENEKKLAMRGLSVNYEPKKSDWEVLASSFRTFTAYNSEVAQCNSEPCITANGFNVCEHGIEDTIAANFLPFGTKVRIPDLFGDRIFIVRDRMNARYPDRVDVWMLEKSDAVQFGVRRAEIQIVE